MGYVVRETRSEVKGATLETLSAYDGYGRRTRVAASGQPTQEVAYAVTGERNAFTQTVGAAWRKQEQVADYVLQERRVWQRQIATQLCSDSAIAPLMQASWVQFSGLSVTNSFHQVTVDTRGNETRTWGDDAVRMTRVPSCGNPQIQTLAFGQLVETVDSACVTNRFEYDALDRQVAEVYPAVTNEMTTGTKSPVQRTNIATKS